MSEEKELGPSEAGKAHDRLADAIRIALHTQCALSVEGGCEDCTERYSATLELAENYARAVAAELLGDAKDDFLFERKQVVALREVLGEIFTCLAAGDAALLDDDQVFEWRQRSGIEDL